MSETVSRITRGRRGDSLAVWARRWPGSNRPRSLRRAASTSPRIENHHCHEHHPGPLALVAERPYAAPSSPSSPSDWTRKTIPQTRVTPIAPPARRSVPEDMPPRRSGAPARRGSPTGPSVERTRTPAVSQEWGQSDGHGLDTGTGASVCCLCAPCDGADRSRCPRSTRHRRGAPGADPAPHATGEPRQSTTDERWPPRRSTASRSTPGRR